MSKPNRPPPKMDGLAGEMNGASAKLLARALTDRSKAADDVDIPHCEHVEG